MAKGLTPADIVNAVDAQNLILPTGTAKIGPTEYRVDTNASPDTVAELNRLPIRTQNGATLYLCDVAHVRDGFTPQTNVVRQDGQRGVLISILKNGDASTLQVVAALKALLPSVAATLPADLKITPLFDQSVFVKAAVQGVIHEALIAAAADRDDDPAVPRQLAQHADHRGVDPAVDLHLDHRALGARRDHQHHDAGRPGARGRDPGGRRHRDHREHRAAPAPGHRAARGDPRRRGRDRRAGAGVHAVHLHRVRADVLPDRRGALPVRAARRSRGVRDARVVRAVAHAGADAGDAAVPPRRAASGRHRPGPGAASVALRAHPPRLQPRIRAPARRLHRAAGHAARAPPGGRDRLPRLLPAVDRAGLRARPRLLPERRFRQHPPAHARPDRHPHRGDRAPGRPGRAGGPRGGAARPARHHRRQPRPAVERHQPVVQQRRHDRHARRRDPDRAEGRPPERAPLHRDAAPDAAAALPRHRILLPAVGHHHADPQLRAAGGDRRAGAGQRRGLQHGDRQPPAQADPHRAGRGRRAHPAAQRRADPADRHGPHAHAAAQPVGAERGAEPADLAGRQLADHARPSGSIRKRACSTR